MIGHWSRKKTEADIDQTHKTVGTYIYDTLLGNPSQKIRGRLVRTIERKYYKEELKLILDKQKEFHPNCKIEHCMLLVLKNYIQ